MAKILVVDDAPFMRMKCAQLLADNGYDVLEAETGTQAVEQYEANRPDGVLLDIMMPEMDGLTALRELRRMDPNARVAMVTALGHRSVVMEALKAGACDFVVKPFDASRVLGAVQKLVG